MKTSRNLNSTYPEAHFIRHQVPKPSGLPGSDTTLLSFN